MVIAIVVAFVADVFDVDVVAIVDNGVVDDDNVVDVDGNVLIVDTNVVEVDNKDVVVDDNVVVFDDNVVDVDGNFWVVDAVVFDDNVVVVDNDVVVVDDVVDVDDIDVDVDGNVLAVVSNVDIEDDLRVLVESDFVLGMMIVVFVELLVLISCFVVGTVLDGSLLCVICFDVVLSIVVDLARFLITSYIHVLKNPILV